MESEVKIAKFSFKKTKRYIQLTDIEGIEIEIEGVVEYLLNGQKREVIRSEARIKPVGIIGGIRFERFQESLQKRAEEILSEAFDDYLNHQIVRRRVKEVFDGANTQEERLNRWFRSKFGKDRRQI